MTCPSCGAEVTPEDLLCRCGAFIDRYAVTPDLSVTVPAQPVAPPAAAPVAPPLPEPTVAARPCPVVWCTSDIMPGASSCSAWGHPANDDEPTDGPSCVLTMPDGTRIDLSEGIPLEIGRESSDRRVASGLAPFDTVSRRHALVALEGDSLRVTHVGRTNPTYANGQLVAPVAVVPLPVQLRLGQSVQLTLTQGI